MTRKAIEVNTKFYTFSQNNSGGGFVSDNARGIGEYVLVEALSYKDANRRAEDIGLYFDGQGDCECCGNRWREVRDDSGKDTPMIYDKDVSNGEYVDRYYNQGSPESYIHYIGGTIKSIKAVKKSQK